MKRIALMVLGGALAGCAAGRPPIETMTAAQVAVEQASESEAVEHAPEELRVAREKLLDAQKAMSDDEYERARRFGEQAIVDAELAETRARRREAETEVAEARKTNELLSQEANR